MRRTALVFLPGLLCDGRLWRDQADALPDIADPSIADLVFGNCGHLPALEQPEETSAVLRQWLAA